jgi:hypothetical protein
VTQTELQLEPRCKPLKRGKQHYEILMYLEKGGRLTVGKALLELNIYALSQRIGELKKQGWPIQSRTVETNGGARVSEYFL